MHVLISVSDKHNVFPIKVKSTTMKDFFWGFCLVCITLLVIVSQTYSVLLLLFHI